VQTCILLVISLIALGDLPHYRGTFVCSSR